MTNTFFYTIIVTSTFTITGCGSGDFTSSGDYEKFNETGGSTGNSNTGGMNGDGDTSGDGDGDLTGDGDGDTNGDGDVTNTGGTSGDGDTGDGDGGFGGASNTGGATNTGGYVGSGGSNTCIPETCEEIGERLSGVSGHPACGIVVNNCGTEVDCSNAGCERYQECGSQVWDVNSSGEVTGEEWYAEAGVFGEIYDKFINENYPSVCGEECVNISSEIINSSFCPNDYPVPTLCSQGAMPDDDDCTAKSGTTFCCKSSGKYMPYE